MEIMSQAFAAAIKLIGCTRAYLHQIIFNGASPGVREFHVNFDLAKGREMFLDALRARWLALVNSINPNMNAVWKRTSCGQVILDGAARLPIRLFRQLHQLTPLGGVE